MNLQNFDQQPNFSLDEESFDRSLFLNPTGDDGNEEEKISDEDFFNSLPAGYRFCPTDEELINHYLKKKVCNLKLPRNKMYDVNIYAHSPQKLSEMYSPANKEGKQKEVEWYFFTPRDRKYANGSRPNRAAGEGYWKPTGSDEPIPDNKDNNYNDNNKPPDGFKKTLVYFEGKHQAGVKTNWLMKEYKLNILPRKRTSPDDMRLDDYVLCKIYRKDRKTDTWDGDQQGFVDEQNNNSSVGLQKDADASACTFLSAAAPLSSMPVYSAAPVETSAAVPLPVYSVPIDEQNNNSSVGLQEDAAAIVTLLL